MKIPNWQKELQASVRDPAALLARLELPAADIAVADGALAAFPMRVPPHFLRNIRKGEYSDPLLRQVLPLADEDRSYPGYVPDPLDEQSRPAAPGLLHKYHGRVLLITTGACAIHCRYCFRRHYPYSGNQVSDSAWAPALDYIRNNPDITEVILSGGDPLTLADEKLNLLISRLCETGQLRRIRIHTRVATAVPSRITDALLGILLRDSLQTIIVNHCNHPNEIDELVGDAFDRIRYAGITSLNQAVLLRGVNDDAGAMLALCERLFEHGVLPYYLHMLDPVAGAGHFEVDIETARSLLETLRRQLPGYLVPRLVREVPGAPYKIPVL